MTKVLFTALFVIGLSGCYTGRGNAYIDYRATSFQTVNHCLHNTHFRC